MAEFYAKGTIKVKNADGVDVSFMPDTDVSNIVDLSSKTNLTTTINKLSERIEEMGRKGGVKVMYEEPTLQNTEPCANKTLIGAIVPVSDVKKLAFTASLYGNPPNGSFYALNDSYSIRYELFNYNDSPIVDANIKINDKIIGQTSIDIAEVQEYIYTGRISREDVLECINSGQPKLLVSDIEFEGCEEFLIIGENEVKLNCIPSSATYYAPRFSITVQQVNSPSSSAYNIGETIQYRAVISNTGNVAFDEPLTITETCSLRGDTAEYQQIINPGEQKTFIGSVVVTENDILNRSGWNVAFRVQGTTFLGEEANASSYRTFSIAASNPLLRVNMTQINAPANGKSWTDGETAQYKLTAANAGNLTLSNIRIVDSNSGVETSIASLAPGGSLDITDQSFLYQIPAGNENGIITLTCSAAADAPAGLAATIQCKKLSLRTDKSSGFTYTVDTTKLSSGNLMSSAPFSASGGTEVVVDWGDGSTTTITSSSSNADKTHTYAETGTYSIVVSSQDWSYTSMNTTSGSVSTSSLQHIYYFRKTLVSVDTIMPALANTSLAYAFYNCTYLRSLPEEMFVDCSDVSSFSSCFYGCSGLTSLPEKMFLDCISATTFSNCFYGCSGITANGLPGTIFKGCTGVTTFEQCFYNCSKIETIPEHLFEDCIGVTNFHLLFYGCTNLSTIPEDLFMHNTAATNMGGVFWYCKNIQYIPPDLVRYNTALTNIGAFFSYAAGQGLSDFPMDFLKYNVNLTSLTSDNYGFFEGSTIKGFSLRIGSSKISTCSYFCYNTTGGYTRIVYVPSGSTTYNTLVAYGNNITVVGE